MHGIKDSRCPYLLSSEATAKGTSLAELAGKEDPVELDSSPTWSGDEMCRISGRLPPPVKYHYSHRFFASFLYLFSKAKSGLPATVLALSAAGFSRRAIRSEDRVRRGFD